MDGPFSEKMSALLRVFHYLLTAYEIARSFCVNLRKLNLYQLLWQ